MRWVRLVHWVRGVRRQSKISKRSRAARPLTLPRRLYDDRNCPIISPVLRYTDGPAAIEWLVAALGFEKLTDFRTPDNAVAHADLRFGTSTIGVSSAAVSTPDSPWSRVRQGLYVQRRQSRCVHDRAVAAGAEIAIPLTDTDYGSRDFSLRDLGGPPLGIRHLRDGRHGGEPTLWPELAIRTRRRHRPYLERALGFTTTLAVPTWRRRGRAVDARRAAAGLECRDVRRRLAD